MNSRRFGTLPTGEPIEQHTLTNAGGASLDVITYGGIVTALRVPDRRGQLADVVLGFRDLSGYVTLHPYFGAIIGRVAGRITSGRLTLAGKVYQLACNNGPNHLHGGRAGFDKRVWQAEPITRADGAEALRLSYRSPDGEEGYPGNVDIAIIYTFTVKNELVIESTAIADCVTPLALTHHSYFNLAGEGRGPINDHELQIFSETCVPADENMTLLGRRETVFGRGNDFLRPRRVGDALPALAGAHGDLYLVQAEPSPTPILVARLVEPKVGRILEVLSDETCLQLYTGSALDGSLVGKSGRSYGPHAGICLECQGYPDGASHPELGDILVRPGKPQRRTTIYAFSTL